MALLPELTSVLPPPPVIAVRFSAVLLQFKSHTHLIKVPPLQLRSCKRRRVSVILKTLKVIHPLCWFLSVVTAIVNINPPP